MRTKLVVLSLSILTVIWCSFMPYPGGAPSPYYYTGSPGDGHSCASCHGNASNVSGWITSNIPASGYVPGSTYQITATNSISGSGKYGFELSPQNISGTLLGTLSPGTNSKLVGSGKWITQSSSSNSVKAWTFNWTAPVAGTGSVTFYGSFARSEGSATKLSTLVVNEQSGTLPAGAGPITGSNSVCQNTNGTYSVSNISGATSYVWSVPTGSSITSGQGTPSIVVHFGASASSGNISVNGVNSFGNGASSNLSVTVKLSPIQPAAISGPTTICEGSTVNYSVLNTSGTNYNWIVPAGSEILSGQGTNSISVLTGPNDGIIEVVSSNSCGTAPGQAINISSISAPGIPTPVTGPNEVDLASVTSSGYNTSGATDATSYQWLLVPSESGSILGNGMSSTVTWNPAYTGLASIKVKALNSCGEGIWSDIIQVQLINTTGTRESIPAKVNVYPIPSSGEFFIQLRESGTAKARILSISGLELYTFDVFGNQTAPVRFPLAPGVYYLQIQTEKEKVTTKLIINR